VEAVMRIIATCIVIAGFCALPARAETYTFLSNGLDSCGQYLAAGQVRQDTDVEWVLGFISGANWAATTQNDRHVGSSFTDPEAINAWVEQYCRGHPLDKIADAAVAIRVEYARREGRR
jgi:hypothetical protein